MPTPPQEGETQQQFMGRCMKVMHTDTTKRPQDQQVAICFSMWRKAHPKDKSAKNPNSTEEAKKKKKKNPYAAMMMSPEEMNKKIDGMTESECVSLMKKMGKYKEGMTIGEMKSMLKTMAKNPELHNKMMGG